MVRVTRSTKVQDADEGIRSRSPSPARTRGRKPAADKPAIATPSKSASVEVIKLATPSASSTPVRPASEPAPQITSSEKTHSQMGKILGFGLVVVAAVALAYYFGHSTGMQQGMNSVPKINVTEIYRNTNATCGALVQETAKNQSSVIEALYSATNKTCNAVVEKAKEASFTDAYSKASAECLPLVKRVSDLVNCTLKATKSVVPSLYNLVIKTAQSAAKA